MESILLFVGGVLVGFVAGNLWYRRNARKTEAALAEAQAILAATLKKRGG